MTGMPPGLAYQVVVDHFGSHRQLHLALARYYLSGTIAAGAPPEWDWEYLLYTFHEPIRTLCFLMHKQLTENGRDL